MQLFTAKQYLKIDIANSYGLDKLTWDERLEWFDAHESNLLSQLSEAENPALYYAGVKAWEDAKAGRASGYPISLDATSSGIQILSVLTGDTKAAELSNVIQNPQKKRVDAYQALYELMLKRVGGGTRISRSDLKQSIMTAFYGSEAVPKEIFKEGKLLQAFFETLEEETPHIWELNKAFLKLWDPQAYQYSWVMPDNFHVQIKVKDRIQEDVKFMGNDFAIYRKVNMPTEKGRSIGANVTHSLDGMIVRELVRRCDHDPQQRERVQQLIIDQMNGIPVTRDESSEDAHMVQVLWDLYTDSGYLSARILDYLTPGNLHLINTDPLQDLLDSLPQKPFKIIPIHDCFRVHPNYGNDLRKQYNLQLSLIAQSNMLQYVLSQLLKKHVTINKQSGSTFPEEILRADYALS